MMLWYFGETTSFHSVRNEKSQLSISQVYGYRGRDSRNNLHVLSTGELVYNGAMLVVIYNVEENTQRFYHEHTAQVKWSVCSFQLGIPLSSKYLNF